MELGHSVISIRLPDRLGFSREHKIHKVIIIRLEQPIFCLRKNIIETTPKRLAKGGLPETISGWWHWPVYDCLWCRSLSSRAATLASTESGSISLGWMTVLIKQDDRLSIAGLQWHIITILYPGWTSPSSNYTCTLMFLLISGLLTNVVKPQSTQIQKKKSS